jgi:hypothetical protein
MSIADPIVRVFCDKCDEPEEFEMTPLVQNSWDCRDLERKLKFHGWEIRGEEHICPVCVEDMALAEKAGEDG